jgi:hypothetical protein
VGRGGYAPLDLDAFGLIGTITGVSALGVSLVVVGQSKKSREVGEDALKDSRKATAHAEAANDIAERALRASTDRSYVDWTAEWSSSDLRLILTHVGAHTAQNVEVVVTAHDRADFDLVHEHVAAPVSRGDDVEILIPQIEILRTGYRRKDDELQRLGIIYVGVFSVDLRITVVWSSEAGSPSSKLIELNVD